MSLTMWWPSPEAFDSLIVEDAEHGFDLSAPDDSECGEWLSYWNQDEEHHKFFEQEFTEVLRTYAQSILNEHGKNEVLPDGSQSDREQTKNDQSGSLAEHEPGCDSDSCPA